MGFSRRAKEASVATDITARYTLWALTTDHSKPVVLIVRPAAAPNAAFMNAAFKSLNTEVAGAGRKKLSEERLHATNVEAAELYAKYVIVGWENVRDDDGEYPEWSPGAAAEFLSALIQPPPNGRPDLFIALRNFCGDIENFRAPVVDAGELGKG